jgi:serine/threonine-protein kinase
VKEAPRLRVRQRLGKYRIERRLAQGGFADVYQAYDTVEGIRVALKIPQAELVTESLLEDFKKEVRLTARLDHPNILPIKNASTIEGRFVIVYRLGEGTLADRLRRRMSLERAFDYAEQILAALAHAHSHRVLHCDVKPENFILFHDSHLRLADFGISKVVMRTMHASGSGTVGYMAPEQAMGRPSLRSDVFAAGLILYRLFAGALPEWPFEWPPPGFQRAQKRLHPDLIALLRRSLQIDPYRRFEDARQMYDALWAMRARVLGYARQGRKRRGSEPNQRADWRELRMRHFLRKYRRGLGADQPCRRCGGPIAESMLACPWCASPRRVHRGETAFPATCPRCRRGVKLDWVFCPWCYGARIGPLSERSYTDKRYVARCPNRACSRREIMPFMRYCPWCRTKIRRPWPIPETSERCPRCRWGVLSDYWSTCPWCQYPLDGGAKAVAPRPPRE